MCVVCMVKRIGDSKYLHILSINLTKSKLIKLRYFSWTTNFPENHWIVVGGNIFKK